MADYFEGYEFLLEEPNRIEDIKDEIVRDVIRRDNRIGPFSNQLKADRPRYAKSVTYLLLTRDAIANQTEWLARRSGRLVPFWCPSWQMDLTLVRDIGPGQSGIRVNYLGYTAHYLPSGGRRRIILFLKGGRQLRKYIMTATDNGDGSETLYFDMPFTEAIPMNEVIMISFVYLVRLDADRITRCWETQGIMRVSYPIVEVVEEGTEIE